MSDAFWSPWELEVASLKSAIDTIHTVFERESSRGRIFAWRGQIDASWGLSSSLYRRYTWSRPTSAAAPDEKALQKEEAEILKTAHRWGLHTGERGRLSILNQLAVLQHYGAPTRLIDITFNPLIGLWFAVEKQWENGEATSEDRDGRLFAIDVTDRLINEKHSLRDWEDASTRPWPRPTSPKTKPRPKPTGAIDFKTWTTTTYAWKPARLDPRIAAQNGGFLLGGVPGSRTTSGPRQWPKETNPAKGKWKIQEVRKAVSVPLRAHKLAQEGPKSLSENPVYTLRIKSTAKSEIRNHLESLYGYDHSSLYPDYSGFARYGSPFLRTSPP